MGLSLDRVDVDGAVGQGIGPLGLELRRVLVWVPGGSRVGCRRKWTTPHTKRSGVGEWTWHS
jgi:hypothetical protein